MPNVVTHQALAIHIKGLFYLYFLIGAMKKCVLLLLVLFTSISYYSFINDDQPKPVKIPENKQRVGDAKTGYQYLITGDYLKSGLPYNFYIMGLGKDKKNYLKRDGINEFVNHEFNAVKASNGQVVVTPNCLQCHAQVFDDQLFVGMGNSFKDFTEQKNVPKDG